MTVSLEEATAADALPEMDLVSLLKDIPRGAWVAIAHDRTHVVSFAVDVKSAFDDARSKGEAVPIMFRVPDQPGTLLL
jgi:hypothetical protein